jgi:ribosome-binding factor A
MEKNMEKTSKRMERIDEEIKRELSQIISYELENSKITGLVSVTKVKTTPDLRYSRVYVSVLNSKNVKDTLAGLKQASGFMRSKIAEKINLRITPELVFELDESLEYGARIDSIIKEISKDWKDTK